MASAISVMVCIESVKICAFTCMALVTEHCVVSMKSLFLFFNFFCESGFLTANTCIMYLTGEGRGFN